MDLKGQVRFHRGFCYKNNIKRLTVKNIFVDDYVFRQKSTGREVKADLRKAAVQIRGRTLCCENLLLDKGEPEGWSCLL